MNWEALGSIGEWVGAVSVVVTPAYLARQRADESTVMAEHQVLPLAIAQDGELARGVAAEADMRIASRSRRLICDQRVRRVTTSTARLNATGSMAGITVEQRFDLDEALLELGRIDEPAREHLFHVVAICA
jgi:hypothetical protein